MAGFFELGASFHMWGVFALVLGAVVFYAIDKVPLELTSIVILALLLLLFALFPISGPDSKLSLEVLLMGFANPALIAVVCLLVVGQAVVQTGALNEVANVIVKYSNNNILLSIAASLLFVMIISALLNNTPVVVIFIPILGALAKRINMSNSKIMIPLSYVAIMGGMMTLIGSSTNLLVSGMMSDLGLPKLHFFSFTLPGAIMAGVGLIYVLFIAPKLLTDRSSLVRNYSEENGKKKFIAQIEVDYSSELIGKQLEDGGNLPEFKDINIRMIQRGEHAFLPPFEDHMAIRAGDIIVLGATRQDLTILLANKPETLLQNYPDLSDEEVDDIEHRTEDMTMAEVVVSPASRMVGKNLEQIAFHHTHDCIVLGIQRHSRVIRARVTEIRLAPGDVLLVMGKRDDILALHSTNDVMLMEWSAEDIHSGTAGKKAAIIFFSVAGFAAFEIIPIAVAAVAGVAAVLLSKCLNLRQAARAIDMTIILMVATSLALGTAMQATGGAGYLADTLVHVLDGITPVGVMSALFFLMMIVTNILSNNASAVLFTPIAAGMAKQLGVDPTMFIFAVIFACNCSFITPIGYQTNLLVMAPGHYKFSDFMKAGVPLAILMWATYTVFCIVYPEFFIQQAAM